MSRIPDAAALAAARQRVAGCVHVTPVVRCRTLDRIVGASLHLKAESLQRAGSFKIRGATNAVRSLGPDVAARGVATHSSGNHAAALALAARERGIPARIVVPSNAPRIKLAAVRGYGAAIELCEPTLAAREQGLARVIERTGAHVVPPYDDPRIVAGQASLGTELIEQVEGLDAIVAPVGGGGLLSGISLAASAARPGIEVFGAEPSGADDARRSLESGTLLPSVSPRTIADGLLTGLGRLPFEILRRDGRRVLAVDDDAIRLALRLLLERARLVVEPSGAVGLAAVLAHATLFAGRRVGVVLSGGNVDAAGLAEALGGGPRQPGNRRPR